MKLKIFLFIALSSVALASNPWQPYDKGYDDSWHSYDEKKKRPIPEPATYFQVGSMIAIGLLAMYIRKRKKSS